MRYFKDMFIDGGDIDWFAIGLAPIKILVFLLGLLWFQIGDAWDNSQRVQ